MSASRVEWILVGTDFSAPSRRALELAAEVGRDRGSSILLLHVIVPEGVEETASLMGLDPRKVRDRLQQEREGELRALASTVSGVPVEPVLSWGHPVAEILRKAREFAVDWIVVGMAGRSAGMEQMLFGGTAEKVLRAAPCPVLCVPFTR